MDKGTLIREYYYWKFVIGNHFMLEEVQLKWERISIRAQTATGSSFRNLSNQDISNVDRSSNP